MMRRVFSLAAAAFFLAGCVGGVGSSDGGLEGLVDDSTGAIVGTVVTEELLPMLVATVNVSAFDDPASVQVADVDETGSFRFGQLVPGEYRVAATSEGFYPRETKVEVRAGESSEITFVMAPRPSVEPFVSVTAWEGFNPCGFALIVTPANICDQRVSNVTSGGPPRTGRNYTIPDGFAGLVAETTWRGSDEISVYYYNRSAERKNRNESTGSIFATILETAAGQNPLKVVLVPNYQRPNSTGIVNSYFAKVSDGGAFEMRFGMWWNGYYGQNFGPLAPVCKEFAVPKCTGVGATVSFRFTHWMSIFMYNRPGDIATYSVIPDS